MAKNPLPILLAGAAALLLLGGKKGGKKKKSETADDFLDDYVPIDIPDTVGPSDGGATKSKWMARQQALATVAGWGKCNCDPGSIDGDYGSKTKAAVRAFQACASIDVDGKWGPATEAAMKAALAMGPTWPDGKSDSNSGGGSGGGSGSSMANNQWPPSWPHMNAFPSPDKLLQFLHESGYVLPSLALRPRDSEVKNAVTRFQSDWNVARQYAASGPPASKFHLNPPPKALVVDGLMGDSTIRAMYWVHEVWQKKYQGKFWHEFVVAAKKWAS